MMTPREHELLRWLVNWERQRQQERRLPPDAELDALVEKLEQVKPAEYAFLVLVTWPNGTEGLLFPRPGNVPLATSQERGFKDFRKAKKDLVECVEEGSTLESGETLEGTSIRLVMLERGAVLSEFKA